MNEWAADGGKFAAAVLTFIVVGLSWLIAWCLRTLLAPPGPPTTPTELGRSWAGWVVFASSVSELSKSFGTFDIFPFVLWLLGASAIAPSAFALGWGYGKWFKFSNQPTPLPNATRSNEPVVAGESITTSGHTPDAASVWLSGEQLDLCEAFIGKKGQSYYLPKFEKFAQQEPRLTPAFNVFPVYKYTAKFFKPTWNWSSFFFVYGWALYRKLYGWSIALFLTSVFCFMAIKEGAAGLGFISLVATYVAFGMYANAIYYSKAKKIVVAAVRTTRSQTQGRLEIGDKCGVNPWAVWAAAGQVLVGIPTILLALLAPHDQQLSTTGNSPKHVAVPSSSEVINTPNTVEAPPAASVVPAQKAAKIDDPYKRMETMYSKQRYGDLAAAVQGHLLGSPNDIIALNYGGLALQALGDMNGAWQLFRKAIALSPEDAVLYYNLSFTYGSDQYKTIIEILTVAKTIDPDNKLINDSLAAWQQHAQKIDFERRAQVEYTKPSSSAGRDDDELECRVKPVMTDAEIRHWRICSQKPILPNTFGRVFK